MHSHLLNKYRNFKLAGSRTAEQIFFPAARQSGGIGRKSLLKRSRRCRAMPHLSSAKIHLACTPHALAPAACHRICLAAARICLAAARICLAAARTCLAAARIASSLLGVPFLCLLVTCGHIFRSGVAYAPRPASRCCLCALVYAAFQAHGSPFSLGFHWRAKLRETREHCGAGTRTHTSPAARQAERKIEGTKFSPPGARPP